MYGRPWVRFQSGTQIFSFVPLSRRVGYSIFSDIFCELKIHHLSIFNTCRALSILLILAVCRTRVTTNSVIWPMLATSLPVAQWLERPTGGHGFDTRRGLRFFLCPTLVTCWIFHLFLMYPSSVSVNWTHLLEIKEILPAHGSHKVRSFQASIHFRT